MTRERCIFDLRAGRTGSKKSVARLYPQQQRDAVLPRLTWNTNLHKGVECLDIVFECEAGHYLLQIDQLENHLRRVRSGSNLRWDGLSQRGSGKDARMYDLQDDLIRKWISLNEAHKKAGPIPPCPLGFYDVDQMANQPMTSLCTVLLDGREAGMFAERFPHYTLTGTDKYRVRQVDLPLLIDRPGAHLLQIKPHHLTYPSNPDAVWARYSSQRVELHRARLAPCPAPLPEHPLRRGQVRGFPLDFWGWQAPLFYQRYDASGVTLEQLRDVFAESFLHGANFVNIYLTDCSHTVHDGYAGIIPWPDELNIDGKAEHQFNGTTAWTPERLRKMNRAAHRCGLAISWYMHVPHAPLHWDVPPGWLENYTQVVLAQFAAQRGDQGFDGLLYETAGFGVDADILRLHERVWSADPRLFFCESETYMLRTTPGLSAARLHYFTCMGRAREDKDNDVAHFDKRWAESRYGVATYFGQMNCRDRKYSAHYGDVGQDAIVKQVNDFVRIHGDDSPWPGPASGFEWLGEPAEVVSDDARQMVYAVSADPVVGALAGRMETYGRGGQYDQTQRRRQPFWYRDRLGEDVDARDVFLQNNYLRIYIRDRGNANQCVFDTSVTAHFDSDAPTLNLSRSLLTTASDGSIRVNEKKIVIDERGPYRARVVENVHFTTNEPVGTDLSTCGGVSETRTYTCTSDAPYVHMDIARQFRGSQPDMATDIELSGYDRLVCNKKRVGSDRWAIDFPFEPSAFLLEDSSGLRPPLCLVANVSDGRGPDFVRWQPGKGMAFWWRNPKRAKFSIGDKEHCPPADRRQGLSIDLVVLGPLYRKADVPHLSKLRHHATSDSPINRSAMPIVRPVSVSGNRKLPVMVNEDGWWRFRGVQRVKGGEIVKTYLKPGGRAKIMRWGLINDLVRQGPGSQYMVDIRDVRGSSKNATLKVRVKAESPAVLPRLEMAHGVAEVRINDKPWPCFDDRTIYLPKHAAVYDVKVCFGTPDMPRLLGTHAALSNMQWNGRRLRFDAGLPVYTKRLPRSLYFYVAINTADRAIERISGAKQVKRENDIVTIRFKTGTVEVTFAND